ncbi:Uncharacterised protein [Salmonella enterica subsp. enterica serovar Typhimurium str. DT104]|nr:Uncharacterised protein [Salmonella enterica subsp. enterica serovar Typhimurium str. DT104]
MEMNHQIAVAKPVFRLCIQGDEMISGLAFTWHHTDVIPADQRIQAGNARQRGFGRHQPELRLFAQRIFHI